MVDEAITTLNLPKIPEEPDISKPLIDYLQSLEHILRTQLTGASKVIEGDVEIGGDFTAGEMTVDNLDSLGYVAAVGDVTGNNLNITDWDNHLVDDGKDHSDVVLNNTHTTSNGSNHSFIDQDVTSGSSPTFDGNNFTGIDANDVDIADAGAIITATDVEGALQENRTAIDLNTTHAGDTTAHATNVPQSAYTQTYATADKTVANPTAVAFTDNSGGSASQTLASITGGGAGCEDATKDAIASLADDINKLIADNLDLRQAVTALIDDLQSLGLVG